MRFPVLQSFEKDTTKVNFTINQLSRGLDDSIANGEISIAAFPGIDLTGATECAAAIQVAIDSVNSAGSRSKTLTIPAGSTLNIATTLRIGNGTSSAMSTEQGIRIKGMGLPSIGGIAGTMAATPVKFLWTGALNGTMFTIAGPLVGWSLENIFFDGANTAGMGLLIRSGQFGNCQNMTIANCRTRGMQFDAFANASFPALGQSNCMHNSFINTWITMPDVAGATGILLTGSNPGGGVTAANSCFNTFVNTTVWCPGTAVKFAIYFQACDSNYFNNVHCVNGSNSAAVTWDYGGEPAWPSSNYIDGIDTSSFSVEFQNGAAPGQFARANYVRLFEGNDAVCPTLANQICINNSEQFIPWAVATGVPDSLVLNYPQTFNALVDGRLVHARAASTNATATPLFQMQDHTFPSGFAAAVITKHGNQPLVPGDIQANAEMILRYRASVPCWELLNPARGELTLNLSVTAAGATQATATALTADWHVVTGVAPGQGVRLRTAIGTEQRVYNADPSDNLNVYPPTGGQIDALAVNAPFVLVPGKHQTFSCWAATVFLSYTAISLG